MQEVEEFIRDWYYDEQSHEFARQLGAFLLRFLADVESSGLSPGRFASMNATAGSSASSSVIMATTMPFHLRIF